jgi:hypothetical protein
MWTKFVFGVFHLIYLKLTWNWNRNYYFFQWYLSKMWLDGNWIQAGAQESCLKNFLQMSKYKTEYLKESRKTDSFKKAEKALVKK